MKKNLLYLWALICSVALFTACSSDDDNDISVIILLKKKQLLQLLM